MINIYNIIILGVIVIYILYVLFEHHKDMALLRTVSDTHRGTKSERRLVIQLLKLGIHPITLYHDLYVPLGSDSFSQIDLVILTKAGIIVVEDKNYSGWIFGNGRQRYWTQVLSYGKEIHRFYNPILQNQGHIKALKKHLTRIANVPFYSVISFSGRCTLRKIEAIPPQTYVSYSCNVKKIIDEIQQYNPQAKYQDKNKLISFLKNFSANGVNPLIVHKHIQYVQTNL